MTTHRVHAPSCFEIFTKVEAEGRNAALTHKSLSGDIDALGALCTGESSILAAKLNGLQKEARKGESCREATR
ncbi:hypothetical protein [Arachnia propionica]|uniref:Uncharacterized protein n=1 Tax=Arachnia propionica TaxID=1750 RepID=A0A3P1WTZ2_9ACTN|nr:hypothetical protein [Arachnia propionica]RRD49476.1 hypothetical protein EII35_08400 [Arachnia propionica]